MKKKLILIETVCLSLIFGLFSCKDEEKKVESREAFDEYVYSLPLPEQTVIDGKKCTDTKVIEYTNNSVCTYRMYQHGVSFTEQNCMDTSPEEWLYVGSMIWSQPYISGEKIIKRFTSRRSPINIGLHSENKSVRKEGIECSWFDNGKAIKDVVADFQRELEADDTQNSQMSFDVKRIYCWQELNLILGAHKKFRGDTDVDDLFDFDADTHHYLIKITQKSFTVATDAKVPNEYFPKDYTIEDFKHDNSADGKMPCYVQNITYGRTAYIAFEAKDTNADAITIALLKLREKGDKSHFEELAEKSNVRIKGVILGKGVENPNITSIDDIQNFMENSGFRSDSPAFPISYSLQYLRGQSVSLNYNDEYVIEECREK